MRCDVKIPSLPSLQDSINMRKTVNKLIWEQIWLNLQDRQFDIWEKKTEFNGEKMKLVFLSLFGVKRRRPSVSPLHILHFSVLSVQCFKDCRRFLSGRDFVELIYIL